MNASPHSRLPRSIELGLLIAVLLVAIVFRFAQFGQVPPGLHYDEAIDAHLAQEIRSGAWPVYFEEGWGREPLYHYLVAFTLNFVPDPTSALRLVSGILGLIQLLAAYLLFRKLFGIYMALIGAAWIAVLFWTVSTSRAGLRNITLTTLATLTALAFWWAWDRRRGARVESDLQPRPTPRRWPWPPTSSFILHPSSFILPGILLGLTLYTYQPSRVVPLVFLIFIAYLFLIDRPAVRARWRSLIVFFGIALVISLPLIVFLANHPGAETGRAFQTEPIRAMLRGDFSQVSETAAATLKMFTVEGGGDPQPLYNISGRPLFVGLGSILFYLGLIVCVVRWKRPAYAFMLIWLIVALLPNMLTAPAPFFYRAIAAQTPTLALPAIGTVALGELFGRGAGSLSKKAKFSVPRWAARRDSSILVIVIAAGSLGQTAVTTWHDYFDVWGNDKDVQFQYSADQTAIAHALDASSDTSPVIISGMFVEDSDPYIFDQTLHRGDLSIRWFDANSALIAVAGASSERVALPSFAPLDDMLKSRFLGSVSPITSTKEFKIYPFDAAAFRSEIEQWATRPGAVGTTPQLPVAFDGNIQLLGIERAVTISRTQAALVVLTAWRVTSEWQPSSTAIFIHVTDANGAIVGRAQDDRLGFPRHGWHTGDEFVQLQRIPIADVPPGNYVLELGVYTRDGGRRWMAQVANGQSLGDHISLGSIEVTP